MKFPDHGALGGIVVAGLVHAGKATARPAVNAATIGVGGPVVSTVEDGASLGLSLVAIFLPVLVLLALVLLGLALFWRWRRHGRTACVRCFQRAFIKRRKELVQCLKKAFEIAKEPRRFLRAVGSQLAHAALMQCR